MISVTNNATFVLILLLIHLISQNPALIAYWHQQVLSPQYKGLSLWFQCIMVLALVSCFPTNGNRCKVPLLSLDDGSLAESSYMAIGSGR